MARPRAKAPADPDPKDPVLSAELAGLRYTTDREPGIVRLGVPPRFRYRDASGRPVRDPAILERIRTLVIPPNWTTVWICASPRGHLQVTARDTRGRKQYRYHSKYRSFRDQTKFDRMVAFGAALPGIRKRIAQDMRRRGMPREKVLAAIVRLMDLTQLRVGNAEYARENASYGLTTMENRHAKVRGRTIEFRFKGKSGQMQTATLTDPKLAAIVQRSKELPGYHLFEYEDEEGRPQAVNSSMVNDYLREITGQDITAKDFRTWHGSVLAGMHLSTCGPGLSLREITQNLVGAIKQVACQLGNRPATCRKFYVHPAVLAAYEKGGLTAQAVRPARGLSGEERTFLALLSRPVKET